MPIDDRAALHRLFLLALAASGAACAEPAAEVPRSPRPNPLMTRASGGRTPIPAELAAAMKTEGGSFRAVDLRRPGVLPVELLNIVEPGPYDELLCDTEPCAPETLALDKKTIYTRAVVVRESGKVRAVFEPEYEAVFGAVDSPEKAALRCAISATTPLARCADLEAYGAPCAEGSSPDGVPVRATDKGFDVMLFGEGNVCRDHMFGGGVLLSALHVDEAGALTSVQTKLSEGSAMAGSSGVSCEPIMLGRMFEGYVDLPEGRTLLEHLVRCERQEAAAVIAFERLADELVRAGAPTELVDAARRGADDERRHARLFADEIACLAAALGVDTPLCEAAPPAAWSTRPLLETLIENAVEGCANETYAALLATYQAEGPNGAPPALRPLYRAIAEDEREHAALGWAIHAWGRAELCEAERAALDRALDQALERQRHVGRGPIGAALGELPPSIGAMAFAHLTAGLAAGATERSSLAAL